MFIAAVYIIAKTWKQPKGPLTEEWIKTMYIYTMEYYSAIKRKETMAFAATWMDLEITMPSEVSQTMRHQQQMLSTCGIWKKDTMNFFAEDTDSQTLVNLWFLNETFWGVGGCTEGLGWKCYKIWLWWSLYNYTCNKTHWVIKKEEAASLSFPLLLSHLPELFWAYGSDSINKYWRRS